MPTYIGQREQELARRVRRMLIEQSALHQDEHPDEFIWLTRNFVGEQHFFEDELGARLELRQGRWARTYWPSGPKNRELCIADVFELTARKQTAYACLIRAYRSVRLLEAGDSASVYRFSELFRYVAEEGQRLSPWLSFDETVINEALATRGEADDAADDDELIEAAASSPRGRKKSANGTNGVNGVNGVNGANGTAKSTATAARKGKPAIATQRTSAAMRVRLNQRAFYQAFAAFERHRLVRRIGADDRARPDEHFRLDERDFNGVYEFTDLIDRFLPPAGLVQYDELNPPEAGTTAGE